MWFLVFGSITCGEAGCDYLAINDSSCHLWPVCQAGWAGVRVKAKKIYEKPVFEKQEGLMFPKEIIEQFNAERFFLCPG